jgi:hypothetical protein
LRVEKIDEHLVQNLITVHPCPTVIQAGREDAPAKEANSMDRTRMVEIDPAAMLLRPEVYIRLKLPDPMPNVDQFEGEFAQLGLDEQVSVIRGAEQLQTYFAELHRAATKWHQSIYTAKPQREQPKPA